MPSQQLHIKTTDEDREKRIAQAIREGKDRRATQIATSRNRSMASYRSLSEKYNVPLGTLGHRIKGRQSCNKAHEHQQKLTVAEEEVLVKWVIFQGAMGLPMSKEDVHSFANTILNGRDTVGQNWHRGFYQRHRSKLCFKRASGLDPKRANGFNKTLVTEHFELWAEIINEYKIPPENIYNMDEKGIQVGGGRHGTRRQFYFGRDQKNYYRVKSDSLELVTIIEAICADGTDPIEPAFIASDGHLGKWWEVKGVGGVAVNDSGWTDKELTEQWFERQFLPQAQMHNTSGAPILLLYDGHISHITDNMITIAYNNNVFLVCLPSKTTHQLQPLDVNVFGRVQNEWSKFCEDKAASGDPVKRESVIEHYMTVRKTALTKSTIDAAWRRSGHYPINPNRFSETDFAPSNITSSKSHVPEDYPKDSQDYPTPMAVREQIGAQKSGSIDGNSNDGLVNGKIDEDWEDTDEDDSHLDLSNRHFARGADMTRTESSVSSGVPGAIMAMRTRGRYARNTNFFARQARRGEKPKIADLEHQLEQLRLEHDTIVAERDRAIAERDSARAHCNIERRVNQDLVTRLHNMTSKPKHRAVDNVFQGQKKHGFLNPPSAGEQHFQKIEEEKRKQDVRVQKEQDKREREEEIQRNRHQIATDPHYAFGGTIAAMKQARIDTVRDLAAALGLSYEGKSKTKLYEDIVSHFDSNPELKTCPKFQSLFSSRRVT
ncbi:DDE superfamily endonuclease [Ceratobasidium sp. AG-Ba]|nr:DDE superfamily endonuclease [Ceratobasidium sp. AG-Ba]